MAYVSSTPADGLVSVSFRMNGKTATYAFTDAGTLHQIVGEYEVQGTDHIVRIYVDKVLVFTSTVSAQAYVAPGAYDIPRFGSVVGSSFANFFRSEETTSELTSLLRHSYAV